MSKFGKWHYDGGKLIRDDDGRVIADILPALDYFTDFKEIADRAEMIAASPEMYDDLYEVLQFLKGSSLYDDDEFAQYAQIIENTLARIDGEENEA